MNEHTQKALEWLQAVVTEAMDVWKQGDLMRLNQITENKAIAYYVNNVHGRPETVRGQWMHWYPGHVKEVERLYTNYLAEERAAENTDKLTALEAKYTALEAKLTALLEAKPPAAEPEPEKPARKKRAKKAMVVTEEAAEPAAEADEDDEAEEEEQEAPAEPAAEEAPETETEDEAEPTEAE